MQRIINFFKKSCSAQSIHLLDLPSECLYSIFGYFNTKELFCLKAICSSFCIDLCIVALSRSTRIVLCDCPQPNRLWFGDSSCEHYMTPELFQRILPCCSNIRNFRLRPDEINNEVILLAIENFKKLEDIRFCFQLFLLIRQVSVEAFKCDFMRITRALDQHPKIQKIHLNFLGFTNIDFEEMPLPQRTTTISFPYTFKGISGFQDRYEHIEIWGMRDHIVNPGTLVGLLETRPFWGKITRFSFTISINMMDFEVCSILRLISEQMPRLEQLQFRCANFGEETRNISPEFVSILKKTNLKRLDIWDLNCGKFFDGVDENFPNLQTLSFGNCEINCGVMDMILKMCPNLLEINFGVYCTIPDPVDFYDLLELLLNSKLKVFPLLRSTLVRIDPQEATRVPVELSRSVVVPDNYWNILKEYAAKTNETEEIQRHLDYLLPPTNCVIC